MKYTIASLILLLSTPTVAELYKWTDTDGIVHYTDRLPAEGIQPEALPGRLKTLKNKKTSKKDDSEDNVYSEFLISKPEADSSVRNEQGTVDILISINPPLIESHFLQIYLDGLQVGDRTKTTALTLQQMQKGIHRLQAQIVDEAGLEIMKTATVSFEYREPADLSKIAPNLVTKPTN